MTEGEYGLLITPLCYSRSLSNSTFSTFRGKERHCYATRHAGERRRHDSKHSTAAGDGYKSDGYKSDGYKSDGYKSDGDGYKSDGAGYKSDGEHVKRVPVRPRYAASPSKQPSKYEQDRLASRRLNSNGDSAAARRGAEYGREGVARCSSRGGYRSDPDHEIEIQLQCMGSQNDDSGGSQHSQKGYSVDEEEKAEWQAQEPVNSRSQERLESRSHSRNGYKSDGSHGSLQESPLHPQINKCDLMHPAVYGGGGRGMRRGGGGYLAGNPQSHSASHLNAHYANQPPPQQRLMIHPTKHLEASRSFHTFQRQESTTSFHSTHSAPNPPHHNTNLMVNNLESASQASTHSHSSSSSASVGPPEYSSVIHPPPTYDQALIKLDIAMRRRAANKNRIAQQQKGTYNSLHYVGEFYG